MAITSQHLGGFAVGLGAAAVGFYLYKKNQSEVDQFLRKHGIDLPAPGTHDVQGLSLEQLVAEKERLEDLIAEREYAATNETNPTVASAPEPEAAEKPRRARTAKSTTKA